MNIPLSLSQKMCTAKRILKFRVDTKKKGRED
jgi:hypothetical protein